VCGVRDMAFSDSIMLEKKTTYGTIERSYSPIHKNKDNNIKK
jgi:hypothetical protein